ncbi:unnamed protein product [Chrysoparadoxa australica]
MGEASEGDLEGAFIQDQIHQEIRPLQATRARKGTAAVPRKPLVRACSYRAPVVMANEFGTSKYCPRAGCDGLMRDLGDRFRNCENVALGCPIFGIDRDSASKVAIAIKFFKELGLITQQ